MSDKRHFIIGIDEVGRGALAGPVFVGIAAISEMGLVSLRTEEKKLGKLKDSKKLSPEKREKWFYFFKKNNGILFDVAKMNPRLIDKINISNSANILALRVYKKIILNREIKNVNYNIFLDGGLYLGDKRNLFELNGKIKKAKTIIKGDENIIAIRVASIVAKVLRDHYMIKIASKYPEYGFKYNKGYGTSFHINIIKEYGASIIHRKTFIKNFVK